MPLYVSQAGGGVSKELPQSQPTQEVAEKPATPRKRKAKPDAPVASST